MATSSPGHVREFLARAFARRTVIFDEWGLYSPSGFLYRTSALYRELSQKYRELYPRAAWKILVAAAVLGLVLLGLRRRVGLELAAPLYAIAYTVAVSLAGAYDEWFRLASPVRPLV